MPTNRSTDVANAVQNVIDRQKEGPGNRPFDHNDGDLETSYSECVVLRRYLDPGGDESSWPEEYKLQRDQYGHEIVMADYVSKLLAKEHEQSGEKLTDQFKKKEIKAVVEEHENEHGKIKAGKRIDIVIGYPGSGKSSVIVETLKKDHGGIEIDSDIFKMRWYEDKVEGGLWANALHEKSSDITIRELYPKMLGEGNNIVYPIIGQNANKVKQIVELARGRGYEVHLHHVKVAQKTSEARNIRRYFEEGRLVSIKYIEDLKDGQIDGVFDTMIGEKGLIDGYSEWNNEVPYGDKPKLIRGSYGQPKG